VQLFRPLIDRLTMQMIYPRSKWAKQVMQTPFVLWRLGLGPGFGGIILVLSATGRRSGQARRVALEFHTMNGKKYAVSAFGTRSAWYRNILADPHVTVQSADGTERMTARRVTDDDELLDAMRVFMRRDPPLTRWYLHSLGIQLDSQSIIANKERIHLLRFDPTNEATPPGLDVDLAWIWPLALVWVWIFRPRRRR
jgi:deazaflavin-dependent oxidoreductase (nitroreductase family)